VSYCASKAAVVGLTRSTAVEYGRSGVRCNAIYPGVVEMTMLTELAESRREVLEALLDIAEATTPLGRLGIPMEIASAAVFPAGDESTYLTGAAIPVDGGYTAV
jgi:NAD(P)-dependent dehydrogenase (short-subunit alcohol dehydrogenase family)